MLKNIWKLLENKNSFLKVAYISELLSCAVELSKLFKCLLMYSLGCLNKFGNLIAER